MFRYLVAFATACAFIAVGLLLARYYRYPEGFDYEVTPIQMYLLVSADALNRFWFVWIPVVFTLCFAIAYFCESGARR